MCQVFFADLAVQILYVHYNICCFILLFYLCACVCKCGDGTSSCVVAMTTSSALFIGHSISVAASRDRPKAIDRADM